jgi:hypothetical protein
VEKVLLIVGCSNARHCSNRERIHAADGHKLKGMSAISTTAMGLANCMGAIFDVAVLFVFVDEFQYLVLGLKSGSSPAWVRITEFVSHGSIIIENGACWNIRKSLDLACRFRIL